MEECDGGGGTDGRGLSSVVWCGRGRKEGKGVRDCQDNNTLLINNVV